MKKNNKVTIVTAFFNIGRENAHKEMQRGTDKYLKFFEYWARIKNDLIIFTEPQYEEEIINIRKKFGLENQTTIITIEDVRMVLPELYEKALEISQKEKYINWRYLKWVMDLNPKYDHLMFLKNWFLNEAVKRDLIKTKTAAWVDFGFNHGGRFINDEETFDVTWEYNGEEKIVIANPKKDDREPIFSIIQSGVVYVEGGVYILPTNCISDFYKKMLESYKSLLACGLMDDDQTVLLITLREYPNLFKCENLSCYEMVKKYVNNKMVIKKQCMPKENIFDKLLYKYRVIKRNRMYLKGIKKSFLKDYLD